MKTKLVLVLLFLSAQIALGASSNDDSNIDGDDTAPTSATRTRAARKDYVGESIFSRIIPEVSLQVSTFVGSSTSAASTKTGFGVGALTDVGRSDFVFETGLLYRQMGASGSSNDLSATINLNYLSIPLDGKYYFNGQNSNTAYVKVGLMPSVLISKDATVSDGTATATTSNLDVNSFDLGVVGGLGGKILMNSKTSFIIEANYLRGLIKLSDSRDTYNSGLTLMAGVGIEL